MNIYDFDKTIFYPDSSATFVRWYYRRHPGMLLRHGVKTLGSMIGYFRGKSSVEELKQRFFAFLPYVRDLDREIAAFWEKYRGNIQPWYLRQKRPDDIIISASPEFLLRPICDELGVRLIATRMDRNTGVIDGRNNSREEKVRRLQEQYPDAVCEEFYSDSLSDTPLAEMAQRAFMVKKGDIGPWPDK